LPSFFTFLLMFRVQVCARAMIIPLCEIPCRLCVIVL
jgi:hypothetical protein